MENDIKQALKHLTEGNVILYPTDTVWGIGCDATNEKAVEKIYRIKQRANTKSMLVLLHDKTQLNNYVDSLTPNVLNILEKQNKPTTIIYPKAKNIAHNLIAEDGSLGIRICDDPFCKRLLQLFNKPLVSTSANVAGVTTPVVFNEISDDVKLAVDYIVEWRQTDVASVKPSSIIKIDEKGSITVIRQ